MESASQLSQDLQFVRSAVERSSLPTFTPPAIALYWGLACLFGFALCDFAPRYSGAFWAIAGPFGGIYCAWIGRKLALKYGQSSHVDSAKETWHWVGMAGAILLLLVPASKDRIHGNTVGQLVLLIVALTYFQAWVRRGDKPILAASLIMAGGFVAISFVTRYAWTLTGVCVCVAMVIGSVVSSRSFEKQHA